MADDFAHPHLKTPWMAILAAQRGDPSLRRQCLERLCGLYYEPARLFIHARIGRPVNMRDDDADDLTQAFFARLLEKPFLDGLDPARGTFRGYLKEMVRNFITDEFRRAGRRDAGGVLTRLSHGLEPDAAALSAPTNRAIHPGDGPNAPTIHPDAPVPTRTPTPDEAFERAWAKALVGQAVEAFRQECGDARREHHFHAFERHAWRPEAFGHPTYRDSAAALGCTEDDVKNHLHRAKKAFRRMLREIVRQTVADDAQVDEEIRELRRYF